MKQSILAVAAGALAILLVTTIVDLLLYAAGFCPPMGRPIDNLQAVVGTAYRILIGIGGAWLTARLAPSRPMKHALILGAIGTVLGVLGVIVTWNKGLGPAWYAIVHPVLAVPEVWLGAKLFEMREPRKDAAAGIR